MGEDEYQAKSSAWHSEAGVQIGLGCGTLPSETIGAVMNHIHIRSNRMLTHVPSQHNYAVVQNI